MQNLFLTNYSDIKFIDKIKDSINKCKAFYFSVSFIKKAGLILLEQEIEEALKRGVKGYLITSTYQNFTDIASLETFYNWMKKYPNFSCHLDFESFGDNGFHSKGYIFIYDDFFEFVVGSTNITRFALLKNIEWNVSLCSKNEFNAYNDSLNEFNCLWDKTLLLDEDLIKKYKIRLEYAIEKWDMDYIDLDSLVVKPNLMQRKALKELRRYRDLGVRKSLVIAATGSGKTYLAAFDARNFGAKRLLFVVHRDAILTEAMNTFVKVFAASRSYGLYTGDENNLNCNFIFASNLMLAKHLDLFLPNEFDYIVFDECHHSVASSYKKIIDYFKPEFLLGLTATPERLDNEDVFSMFDTNVPFELRLRDAIINDLVVPFHYYGIRDQLVDYSFENKTIIAKEIAKVNNVDFIVSEIEKHRPLDKLKCIAFCTNIAHAKTMAEEFIESGYDAISLTGDSDLGKRIKAFKDLQDDTNSLEIICAVDILNEGVDIPRVNMVLFLRPTESPTIFLQQLGRGLRKTIGKEYLTVLDFIGSNYDRSVQIASALGSLGTNCGIEKAYLRELVRTDFTSLNIPGVKIVIDNLAKEEIINNLNKTNFNLKKFLTSDYNNFKKYLKLRSYPKHIDYLNSDIAPDLIRFMKAKINGKKSMSYYSFLQKIEEDSIPLFNEKEKKLIDIISDYLPLTRVDEYLIINQVLNESLDLFKIVGFNNRVNLNTLNNALYFLKRDKVIIDDKLNIDNISIEFKEYLLDLLNYGMSRYEIEFGDFSTSFKLYANYYKEQIMKELLEKSTMSMKGTKFDTINKITYCFVGLKKDKTKEERMNYKDKFINKSIFEWESENDTTLTSSIGKKLLDTKIVHLFIRKVDEEDGITLPFTYFGTGKFANVRESYVMSLENGKEMKRNTLLFDIVLDNEVPDNLHFDFEIPLDLKE